MSKLRTRSVRYPQRGHTPFISYMYHHGGHWRGHNWKHQYPGRIGCRVEYILDSGFNDLSKGLADGLNYGWSILCLSVLSGGLVICAFSGGLAVLRHFVLRLLLSRMGNFPWQAVSFLEDAKTRTLLQRVGGGYSFMHRLLLDYFADLDSGDTIEVTSIHFHRKCRRSILA